MTRSNQVFSITSEPCNECLFSANKIVSNERRKEIIEHCLTLGDEKFFICHKATLAGKAICCRGFYDTYGDRVAIIQIAQRLNALNFVDVSSLERE